MQLKRGCSGVWIAAAAAVLDRITKSASLGIENGGIVPLIPGLINIRPVVNTGMAFSMFSGRTAFLTAVTILMVAGLAAWLIVRPDSQTKLMRTGLWMVAGGGLGNVYDRLLYGHVIDFIELDFVRFAIFNVADIFICVGVGLTALGMILDEMKKEHPHE